MEIRDETCQIIGRGLHKQDKFEKKRDELAERVADEYFLDKSDLSKKHFVYKPPRNDYMKSATSFANQCELWGYGGDEGTDDSALRKKMYAEVLIIISAIKNALEEKNKGTSCAQ